MQWGLEPRTWWGFAQREWRVLSPPARRPELAEQTTDRTLPSASRQSPHQHRDEAAQAQVKAGCVSPPLAGTSPVQSCDKVLTVRDVETGELFRPFLLLASWGFGLPPQSEWCGVVSSSLDPSSFQPSSLRSSLNPFPSQLLSSSPRLLSTRCLPIFCFTSLTTLSPADTYKSLSSHIRHPRSAQSPSHNNNYKWLPGQDAQNVGRAIGKCYAH